jgi:DNA-binding MarR family transcriptional regulator
MTPIPINVFAEKLNEIIPVLMKEFAKRQENDLFKGKLTFPQFVVLNTLHHEGPTKMTDLAHFMRVTTAAMTGIVNRLVRAGYVLRAVDPKDRRIIKVKLDAKGLGVVSKVEAERRHMIIEIFGRISEIERDDYLRILTHIRDILLEQKKG